jgi:hypothetical protein
MFGVRVVSANVPKGGDILMNMVSAMLAGSAWFRRSAGPAQTHTACAIA